MNTLAHALITRAWQQALNHVSRSKTMSDKCEKCGTEKECLAGRSAHPSNWYCPNKQCDLMKRIDETLDSMELCDLSPSIANVIKDCKAEIQRLSAVGEPYACFNCDADGFGCYKPHKGKTNWYLGHVNGEGNYACELCKGLLFDPVLVATAQPSVAALIAEIDGLGTISWGTREQMQGVDYDELKAILDKYRSKP